MEEIKMKMQEYVGTRDHTKMYNRDLAKQHPIKAIEGLEEKIAELEEYHVYLYNRIGELKQIMEQEKLSLQNITDAEQAAKLNILTTQNTASNALGITRDEAMTQIRVAGDAAVDKLEEQETAMQDLLTIASSKAEEAEGYAREAESYAEAAQVDVEAVRAEKVGYEDYATNVRGGVVKTSTNAGFHVNADGEAYASSWGDYSTYEAAVKNSFMSKGSFEVAVAGKGLVSDTDYATPTKGGVVKASSSYAVSLSSGLLRASIATATSYKTMNSNAFISKGTLENVLADKLKDYVRKDEV